MDKQGYKHIVYAGYTPKSWSGHVSHAPGRQGALVTTTYYTATEAARAVDRCVPDAVGCPAARRQAVSLGEARAGRASLGRHTFACTPSLLQRVRDSAPCAMPFALMLAGICTS